MRSGSNLVYLRGALAGVTLRTIRTGKQLAEVHLSLPLGREQETGRMVLPLISWNPRFIQALTTVPAGTRLMITGHVSARRWMAGGVERAGTEIQIDHVAIDASDAIDVWRQPDPAPAALTETEPS